MSKKKILVIDDDEALRDAYQLALQDSFDVTTAIDGVDGVEKFLAMRPDMIFLDLRMPRLDGIGALQQIRSHNTAVPIYIVTAFSREYMDELSKAREAGCTFELAVKPLTSKQIQAIVSANI